MCYVNDVGNELRRDIRSWIAQRGKNFENMAEKAKKAS